MIKGETLNNSFFDIFYNEFVIILIYEIKKSIHLIAAPF
jgi:hypothetical protein